MIIGCEHHSGMGLCAACVAEQQRQTDRENHERARRLESSEADILRAAEALERAGEYHLARQLRQKVRR